MHFPTPNRIRALLTAGALSLAPVVVRAQSVRPATPQSPEVRAIHLVGVNHVDQYDLLKSISTQTSKCRSFLLRPFCLVSHSPTFEFKFYLDEAELRRDVLRIRLYYWKRGYRDTQVDTAVKRLAPNQVEVTFTVNEGPPTVVRKIAIAYDSTLLPDKVRNRLTLLHAKSPIDLIRLDSMRVLFQNELWDRGYGDAVVDTTVTVDQAAHVADVGVTLIQNRPTTIGRITVVGNQRVNTTTIMNSLAFKTGDPYRQSTILESQRNLYESNLFRLASIDVPPQYTTVKNVTIDVTEAPLHEARFGPGLNNIDFFQFQAHYTSYNLFGGARRLDIDGAVGNLFASSLQGRGIFRNVRKDVAEASDSNVAPYLQPTYTASIDFRQPAFLRRPADAAGFGLFAHRSINPGVFIDRGYGGQATFTHTVRVRAPVSLNYRYEINNVSASDVYFCVNFGVCDTPTIASFRSHQSLSPLTLTGFVDRSDLPFSPTKGYVARVDLEHASSLTASDYRYNRFAFDGAAYTHRSGTQNVYTAHLRFGFVRALASGAESGVLHPRKRFYAGGANSVRGYGESQLGPRVLTIDETTLAKAQSLAGGTCQLTPEAVKFCDPNSPNLKSSDFLPQPLGGTSLLEGSVEYRFPVPLGLVLRNIVGAVFLDGAVVGSGNTGGLPRISAIVKGTGAVTPGFGFRYESPVGPIRVDFGINPNRAEDLAVVTAVRDSTGQMHIVPLSATRNFSQGKTLLSRLTLHFSIGEAY
ncbi:MAG: surface antigen [Gemmatimonadetes bacterium]|nr:surface antigen [Gemmatimonadota bacterium]